MAAPLLTVSDTRRHETQANSQVKKQYYRFDEVEAGKTVPLILFE